MTSLKTAMSPTGPVVDKIFAEFKKQFAEVIQENASEIENIFMNAYDNLAAVEEGETGAAIRGRDPTSLTALRPLFIEQIRKELASNIVVEEGGVVIRLMEEGPLGFGAKESPKGAIGSVDILYYYLAGSIDEVGFITPEQYEARGRRSSKPLGRVGAGFLIPRKRYEQELWQEVTGLTFSDIRHPISGQRPYKGFEHAVNAVAVKIVKEFVPEAVKRAEAVLNPIVLGG